MKNILLPTDFSENSRNALKYAIQLADRVGANVKCFHAYHIPYIHAEMPAGMYQTAIEEAEKESKDEMEKVWDKVKSDFPDLQVTCDFECKMGFAVEEILNAAERNDVDLIVMGTQGVNSVADVIFGSITSSILDKAQCPVLAVPENSEYQDPKNIAFATAYDESDLKALNKLSDFAQIFNANLNVIHVNKEGDTISKENEVSFSNKIREEINYQNLYFDVTQADDVTEGISNYIHNNAIDMVALMKKKHSIFEKVFHRSISRKMAYHSDIPMLAYHE